MRAAQARDMAAYNQWMNQRIFALCEEMSDADRKQDRQAFFKSIHATLNHILLADKIWMGRFTDEPYVVAGLDAELHADFAALKGDRERTDQAIIDWAGSLTDELLEGRLEYQSLVNPAPRRLEMWLAVSHFFNHQTHHRGQLTTLLTQAGLDVGVTDLIWLPQVLERNAF
ncbi:DinB family protein [Marinobacterium sp. YM272]|uniref:DinB family protein n=1 Tax=Marinobacterium sp. YM272 TaxID=3421654 RepID=UPI003D7FBD3F